jgi:hypothetical protein
MFLRILDPDQGPLVQGTDPAPDPCIIKQKKFLPLYVMHIAYRMYSIVSLLRAVPDSDSSIISDPSGSECERLSVLHFNFLLHIFSFESIRTVHCFRVIREEGLGAPVQSGWRKGAPPLSTAAGEKARCAAPVHSGQRKGTPHRLCLQRPAKRGTAPHLRWQWWTTQATLESSVETVKAGAPGVIGETNTVPNSWQRK